MSLHLLVRVIFYEHTLKRKKERKTKVNFSIHFHFLRKKMKTENLFHLRTHNKNKGHLTKISVRMESIGKTSMAVKCTDREFEAEETKLQRGEHSGIASVPRVGRQNLFQSNRTDVWHPVLGVPPEGNYLPDRTLFWNLISWRSQLMV